MEVVVNKQRIKLGKRDVLGAGGEATIFRNKNQALKIYFDPTSGRAAKLKDLLLISPQLPSNVIGPLDLVFDARGQKIIGFTMKLLPPDHEIVARLSNKSYRIRHNLSTKKVTQLFIRAHKTLSEIHAKGLVVGDLNDLNEVFQGQEIFFIDVDSFQFGRYPCLVATEKFLDPNLYGKDFSKQPCFKPENDWYSFAVLLFQSLLLVHPYGGIHPQLKQITQRAKQRITVFDSGVIYPKVGYSPEILSDELLETFFQYFKKGQRGLFPLVELEAYQDSLVKCPSCEAFYPAQRNNCPQCTARNIMIIKLATSVKGCRVETLIETSGRIIFFQILGTTLYALADEDGLTVLYCKEPGRPALRKELFRTIPGAGYGLMDGYLIISPEPTKKELMVIDIKKARPEGVFKTTTELFAGKRAVFGASQNYLYRIAGGMLMRGEIKNKELIERVIAQVMLDQTWFAVSPNPEFDKETVFGFSRIFQEHRWFLISPKGQFEVKIPPLEKNEEFTDLDVKFSANSLLLLRKTRQAGQDFVHIETISLESGKIFVSYRIKVTDLYSNIHGQAYQAGIILHPTDRGVVREKISDRVQTTFTDTEQFVGEGDTLYPYERGILVVKEDRVIQLTLLPSGG
jgi:H/ACA ribonucleoprotein complex subunit 3